MPLFKGDSKATTTVKTLPKCLPRMIINKVALSKMQLFIEGCSDEIGWLGTATKENNVIVIDDVFLFHQEVNSTTTEITPEGLSSFAEEILQQDGGMDIWNNLKVWGHSHVNMSVSPSGQDDRQMETFADGGHNWFVRIIANKKSEIRVDLYDYEAGIIYNTMQWQVGITPDEAKVQKQIAELQQLLEKIDESILTRLRNPINEEIKEKVKKKYQATFNSYQSGYWRTNTMGTEVGGTQLTMMNTGKTYMSSAEREKKSIKKKEIRKELDIDTFLELGEAMSLPEVREVLYRYGYAGMYTQKEMIDLWEHGRKVVENIYSGIYEGGIE